MWSWSEKTDQTFTPNAVSPQQSVLSQPLFVFIMLQYNSRIILLDLSVAYSTIAQLCLVIIYKMISDQYSKSNMDLQNIKRPQDYQKYCDMSTVGLAWLNGKGTLIPLLQKLGTHVEAIDPTDLWNSMQTWNKVHTVPGNRSVLSNRTAVQKDTPP